MGLSEFQVEVGHVDFLAGILEQVNMEAEIVEEFKTLLENKNYFGIEDLVNNCNFDDDTKNFLIKLPEMTGQEDVIKSALSLVKNEKSLNALDRLQKVYNILCEYGYEKYVSFDLGMVSNYNYYTGIILRAYTYGTGDAIAAGGRYDKLLSQFGKNSPSIGFVVDVDNLLTSMNRQGINVKTNREKTVVVYDNEHRKEALDSAKSLRNKGVSVTLICKCSKYTIDDYKNMAQNSGANLQWLA